MIVYNGSSGSLGRYVAGALDQAGLPGVALRARLEDRRGLRSELESLAPARGPVILLQLAARVSVPLCEQDPAAARRTNVADSIATVKDFLDWASSREMDATVVYVSTGHVYAATEPGRHIRESDGLAPRSTYAETKLLAERGLSELCGAAGSRLLIARVFGLVAPRQPPNYVLPGLIRRVRAGDVTAIAGLDFLRDYLDARDVCSYLIALAREPKASGIVNVCSGRATTIRTVLELVAREFCPESAEDLLARATAAPGRKDDLPWIVGDPARLHGLLGPSLMRHSLAQTVRDARLEMSRDLTVEEKT